MNWLAHHEFGLGHKPLISSTKKLPLEPNTEIFRDPEQLNYWLNRWIDAYSYYKTILAPSITHSYAWLTIML